MGGKAATKVRDRDGTAQRIVDAAIEIIVEGGIESVGINALARRAACDKQLVYRYFDGLPGVMRAVGAAVADRIAGQLGTEPGSGETSYRAFVAALAEALLRLYREEPLMRRIKLAELSADAALAAPLAEGRSRVLSEWMLRRRGDLVAPREMDAPAFNAILIGAIEMAALSAHATGTFAGMRLTETTDWDRLSASLLAVIGAMFDRSDAACTPSRPQIDGGTGSDDRAK